MLGQPHPHPVQTTRFIFDRISKKITEGFAQSTFKLLSKLKCEPKTPHSSSRRQEVAIFFTFQLNLPEHQLRVFYITNKVACRNVTMFPFLLSLISYKSVFSFFYLPFWTSFPFSNIFTVVRMTSQSVSTAASLVSWLSFGTFLFKDACDWKCWQKHDLTVAV